jgi:hypothetical protein
LTIFLTFGTALLSHFGKTGASVQPHSGVQVHPCIELPVAAKKQYCKRKNIYISLKVFDTGIVRLCFHKFLELFYNKKTILQKIYFLKFHFWSETETSLCYKFLLFSEISWIILHHLTSKIDYEISATYRQLFSIQFD